MNILRTKWSKIIALTMVLGLISAGTWFLFKTEEPISDFNDQRDTQEILNIFKRDRYWLLASEDYSPEFMLKHHAPNQELKYMGRLNIKVMHEKERFVGFTAYYMKTPEFGFLLFLAVNPEFRGKKYAEKLLKYALEQMKTMGAEYVQLCTRTDNMPAQGLYRRVGFHEISKDDGFVYFQYDY